MAVSKFERLLLTRVDILVARLFRKLFGWFYVPVFNNWVFFIKGTKSMYIDFDDWEDANDDFDDSQLFKLGLDVESINDKRRYWEYNPRTDRDTGDRRGRSRNRPPEWV